MYLFSKTTAYLRKELKKESIEIVTSETFVDDPSSQVKSLKVSCVDGFKFHCKGVGWGEVKMLEASYATP